MIHRNLFKWAFALCAMQLLFSTHAAQAQGTTSSLACESHDYRPLTCDVREPLFVAYLSEQLDRGGNCLKPGNMQILPTGVFVTGGCRGRFVIGFQENIPTYQVACSSDRYQPRTCVAPAARDSGKPIRALWLSSRDSKSPCVVGENVLFSGDSVQVSGGCRATFTYTLER